MIKLFLLGLWVCAVTLGATYAMMQVSRSATEASTAPAYFGGLDYVKTQLTGVPIIRSGKVQGYVMAQFVYTAEQKTLVKMSIRPELLLTDAAFKRIYADDALDYRQLGKQDLQKLVAELKDDVNRYYGKPIVKDILLETLDYLPIEVVRGGLANVPGGRVRP
jgi:hypothetical protein